MEYCFSFDMSVFTFRYYLIRIIYLLYCQCWYAFILLYVFQWSDIYCCSFLMITHINGRGLERQIGLDTICPMSCTSRHYHLPNNEKCMYFLCIIKICLFYTELPNTKNWKFQKYIYSQNYSVYLKLYHNLLAIGKDTKDCLTYLL